MRSENITSLGTPRSIGNLLIIVMRSRPDSCKYLFALSPIVRTARDRDFLPILQTKQGRTTRCILLGKSYVVEIGTREINDATEIF